MTIQVGHIVKNLIPAEAVNCSIVDPPAASGGGAVL